MSVLWRMYVLEVEDCLGWWLEGNGRWSTESAVMVAESVGIHVFGRGFCRGESRNMSARIDKY